MEQKQKKPWVTPTMTVVRVETESGFLAGSVAPKDLTEKEYNIYTDTYEDKGFNWDNISFE